jgi:hypothetical protein
LQIIARQAHVNLMLAGGDDLKVTAHLKQVSVEQALEVLLKPLGLTYRVVAGCYVVGKPEQLAVWDTPVAPAAPVKAEPPIVELYEVRFVNPLGLLQTLSVLHPDVRILPGVPPLAPALASDESQAERASAPSTGQSPAPTQAGAQAPLLVQKPNGATSAPCCSTAQPTACKPRSKPPSDWTSHPLKSASR